MSIHVILQEFGYFISFIPNMVINFDTMALMQLLL